MNEQPLTFRLQSEDETAKKYKKLQPEDVKPKRQKRDTRTTTTYVDRLPHPQPSASAADLDFRHGGWAAQRHRVRAALVAAAASQSSLAAFDNCGAETSVWYCDETKEWRLGGCYCHSRHCQPCMKAKATLLQMNLRAKIDNDKESKYRFITLTMQHADTDLAAQIRHLYESFKRLRKSATWHTTQSGGAAILEVKWSPETRQWHPHLHIVSAGKYLAQQDLSDAWRIASRGSYIVDIRRLDSAKDAAHYLAKYVTKGTSNDVWQDAEAAKQYVLALKGVRAASTFGTWRGYKLLAKPNDGKVWRRIETLDSLYARAVAGSAAAANFLVHLYLNKQYDPHRRRNKKAPTS